MNFCPSLIVILGRLVEGIKDWSYDDRLEYLQLSRLVTRRVRSDLIETFKIMNNMHDIKSALFFQMEE